MSTHNYFECNLPTIAFSAKDISPEERKILSGQIEALYQKESLQTTKFIDQLNEVTEDKSGSQGS